MEYVTKWLRWFFAADPRQARIPNLPLFPVPRSLCQPASETARQPTDTVLRLGELPAPERTAAYLLFRRIRRSAKIRPMPIHPALKNYYAGDWRLLSDAIRFGRAGGRCEACDRPHRTLIYALADGRWFDPQGQVWRDRHGAPGQGPQPDDAASMRRVRVVIATAHLDHDPTNRDPANLRALCQRCHLRHDLAAHLRQRRVTCRRRDAVGDLFLGPYPATPLPLVTTATEPGPADREAMRRSPVPASGLCDLGQAEVYGVVCLLLPQHHIALPGQLQAGDQAAGRAPA